MPELATIIPAVLQLRRKRDMKTGTIKKNRACMIMDGSRMQQGVQYDHSYAQVASWNSIRLLLTMKAVYGWHTKQLVNGVVFP